MRKLTIKGSLPGLNEYIAAERSNRYKAAHLKKTAEKTIMLLIKSQLRGYKPTPPVFISYHWYEKDKRRDKSNVCAYGRKLIEDSLVKTKILANDGWRDIAGFTDEFTVDKANPRIEVTIRGGANE